MKYIGAHVSIRGGVQNAPVNAHLIGAKAFALFTANQRRWINNELTVEQIDAFQKNCLMLGFSPKHVIPHAGYLINLGHPDRIALQKSRQALLTEIKRCRDLGLQYLNVHPGAHLGRMKENRCLQRIAASINLALEKSDAVTLVIENTAGQGTQVGFLFEHLATIIHGIEDKSRIGVCLDTTHLFAAGYDLRNEEAYQKTIQIFENIVGFEYLRCIHLNDSKKPLASRVDRHANIGKGFIGLEAFRLLVRDPRLEELPFILETPDPSGWAQEIELLYSQRSNEILIPPSTT